MKKTLSVMFAIIFAVGICFSAPVKINAEAASVKDLTFGGYVLITSTREWGCIIESCDKNATGEIKIPSTYDGFKVASIAESAFEGCDKITSVVLPDTIISIENNAFKDCTALKSITIPDSVSGIGFRAFYGCTSLKSAVLPKGLERIEGELFAECKSLEQVSIPSSVTVISHESFFRCSNLNQFTIPGKVLEIGSNAFYDTKYYNTESNWVGRALIKDNCFLAFKATDDDQMDSYSVPRGVRLIASEAFASVGRIRYLELPDTVVSINSAFENTAGISEVFIPDSVLYMREAFFYSGLWKVNVPKKVKNMYNAFAACTNLQKVTLPNGLNFIGSGAFSGCRSLENITIPNSMEYIEEYAFASCDNLKKIALPQGIKKIGHRALGYYHDYKSQSYFKYSDFTIYGVKGTAAETYAKQNGFKAVLSEKIVLSTPSVKISNTAKGVKVSWNAVKNAENYIIYRQTYNTSTKKWSNWSTIKKGVTGTAYVDSTVKLGTQYRYTVRAVKSGIMSSYKSSGTLKYNVTPTVKIANASNGVKVSWSTATNATGYTVYRSQYNTKTKKWSGWSNRGTAKANITSWTDKKVTSGVQYKYTVRACNGSFKSSYKESAKVLYLAQPTVKIANASNGIKVSWNKVAGSKGYIVYRSQYTNGAWSSWKNMGTAKNTKTSWVDKNVVSGVTYRYTVRVINGNYKSNYKATSGLIYLAQPTVKIANDSKGVKVSWNQIAGAKGYIVYRSQYTNAAWSSWKNLGSVSAVSWVDESVVSGVQYKYTVRAVNGNYKSAYTASSVLLHLTQPYVEAEKNGTAILLTWKASVGAENYIVYRSEYQGDKWTNWSEIFNSKSESYQSCSYLDESVKPGITYRYTAKAVKGNYESTFNTNVSFVTLVAAPKVNAQFVSNEIVVSWEAVPNAIAYHVYRKSFDSENNRWTGWELVSRLQESLTYKDNDITFSVDYKYAVKALSVEESSEYGESQSVRANIATVVTATYKDDGVHISWKSIPGVESYNVYKCEYNEETGEWGDWLQIKNNLTSTEYIDTDVITGSYKYAVCAKKGGFYGPNAFSDVVKCDVSVYVSIGNKKILFSDDADSLKASFGAPTEVLVNQTSKEKSSYYVYSNDYSKLTIVTLTDSDGVVSVYTLDSSAVFKTGFTETSFNGYNGESYIYNTNGSTEYFVDELGTKSVYAVMFSKRYISANNIDASGDMRTYERLNFHCTNACRAINNVKVLSYNENVATVARAHSKDMADRNYFSHTNLENASSADRLSSGGIYWIACGENIDAGYRTPFDMSDGWYNSSGHRSNILNSFFTHLGVGIAYNPESDYGFYGTQNFIA